MIWSFKFHLKLAEGVVRFEEWRKYRRRKKFDDIVCVEMRFRKLRMVIALDTEKNVVKMS